jgi:hypothetical protein
MSPVMMMLSFYDTINGFINLRPQLLVGCYDRSDGVIIIL